MYFVFWKDDAASVTNGSDQNDYIWGGKGDDTLHGGAGNDWILGNEDNDRLYGDAGNDTLDGGTGNDILDPGPGSAVLIGGAGADLFVTHGLWIGETIIVKDYRPWEGDQLAIGNNTITGLSFDGQIGGYVVTISAWDPASFFGWA